MILNVLGISTGVAGNVTVAGTRVPQFAAKYAEPSNPDKLTGRAGTDRPTQYRHIQEYLPGLATSARSMSQYRNISRTPSQYRYNTPPPTQYRRLLIGLHATNVLLVGQGS